jgi:hypothetical protein
MQFLPQTTIGAAGTFVGPVTAFNLNLPRALTAGLFHLRRRSVDAYLQTNVDGGAVQWADVAHFAFATSSLVTVTKAAADVAFTQGAPTDAGLAAGTTNSLIGPLWRVKYVTAGTYAPVAGTITFVSNPSANATVTIGGKRPRAQLRRRRSFVLAIDVRGLAPGFAASVKHGKHAGPDLRVTRRCVFPNHALAD